ncbi:MAG: c-type cytochrome biogenesis protein CcmI [Gammaproteobacteria bacterium]|nr:c-type cytochrome biogenesis protein CcmI [Gammaproteobacteria bacterium]
MLWFGFIIVSIFTLLLLLLPVIRQRSSRAIDRASLNKQLYQEQSQELERQRANQEIDDEAFVALDLELKKRLLADAEAKQHLIQQKPAHLGIYRAMLAAIPVIALGLYFTIADWREVSDWYQLREQNINFQNSDQTDTAWLEALTNRELLLLLRTRLYENPQDTRGWMIYASSLQQLGAEEAAIQAVQRAIENEPSSIPLKLNAAQLIMQGKNPRNYAVAAMLVRNVLQVQPQHEGALTALGFISRKQGDYQAAIDAWEYLLAERAKRGEEFGAGAQMLQQQIEQTKALQAQQQHMEAIAGKLDLTVQLTPELAASLNPNLTVFIVVRGSDGQAAPVAVKRVKVADLPLQLSLTDADAMIPGRTISGQESLTVSARVSYSGSPKPLNGDWVSPDIKTQYNTTEAVVVNISQQVKL